MPAQHYASITVIAALAVIRSCCLASLRINIAYQLDRLRAPRDEPFMELQHNASGRKCLHPVRGRAYFGRTV
jgi:hypothetical protein